MVSARYFHSLADGRIQCDLCPHRCCLADGQTGICRVRRVEEGVLKAIGYGHISAEHVDPIEKKPLYRFHPGSMIYSIGGWGCNFGCSFCQNWTISQRDVIASNEFSAAEIVDRASACGSIGIAYTYNEPTISFEFVCECAVLARKAGLENVLVTNGYINRAPAAELLAVIDALNIDIKSMDDSFYVEQCNGRLQPVLDFALQAVESGSHVEITNLVIPGLNDEDRLISRLSEWIASRLGRDVPLHLSAYYPQYKLKIPPTLKQQVVHARELALKHLLYVYTGNV